MNTNFESDEFEHTNLTLNVHINTTFFESAYFIKEPSTRCAKGQMVQIGKLCQVNTP